MQSGLWQRGGIVFLFMTFMAALFLSTSQSTLVYAQLAEPTATPTDPVWLAFSAAREAIQTEKKVNLRIVRQWNFFQDDWSRPNAEHPENAAGIDSCVSTTLITQARRVFFGWTIRITDLRNNEYQARVSFDLRDVAVCDIFTVSTPAAGDDSAEADPNLPAPVAGSGATGAFELGGHVLALDTPAINAMRQSGMTWVKKQIRHTPGMSANQWSGAIAEAKAAGFKILLGVVGQRDRILEESYRQEWVQFVGGLARLGADAIEVWNEPNIDREWPTGQVNGATYTALLAPAYNAIKTSNANTIVISGAPAPTGFFGAAGCAAGGCNDDVFMRQMAEAGAARYMDCVGLHYNEGIIAPSANSGDPRGNYPTYYFGSMTARGFNLFGGKPVCYTELGYLSGQGFSTPLPGGFAWAANVTVAQHAAWLAEAASIAAQRGNVRMMIVWNVNYQRFDSDPMGGYAMIRPDGTCPACSTLGSVMGR